MPQLAHVPSWFPAQEFITDPATMREAYWSIRALDVYQRHDIDGAAFPDDASPVVVLGESRLQALSAFLGGRLWKSHQFRGPVASRS